MFNMKQLSAITWVLAMLGNVQAVRFLGRVNPQTRELTWPGTGVSFSFTGSSASINFDSVTGANNVLLTVDGKATSIPNVNGSSILTPAGLANGNHTVQLRKQSEAYFGSIFIGNITTDGALQPDVLPTRKIEFIGDSVTVGYGIAGVLPCVNSADLEQNSKTYAALAAEALDADYSIVAWSGIGVVRNAPSSPPDPSPTMPLRYTKYGAQDADNSYTFPESATPDAVVINLGTNDFNYVGARDPLDVGNFTSVMVSFVRSVRTHYPDAEYFLLTSPLLSDDYPAGDAQKTKQTEALSSTIAQLNSTRVHLVDWPARGNDNNGCDYHPNLAANAAQAPVLAAAIAKELGW